MVWMSEKKLGKRATKKITPLGWTGSLFEVICGNSFDTNPLFLLEGILTFVFVFGGRKRGLKGKTVRKNHCFCGFYESIPQHSEKVIFSNSYESRWWF